MTRRTNTNGSWLGMTGWRATVHCRSEGTYRMAACMGGEVLPRGSNAFTYLLRFFCTCTLPGSVQVQASTLLFAGLQSCSHAFMNHCIYESLHTRASTVASLPAARAVPGRARSTRPAVRPLAFLPPVHRTCTQRACSPLGIFCYLRLPQKKRAVFFAGP